MRKSRFSTEQIIDFIKQAEAGMAVSELGQQTVVGYVVAGDTVGKHDDGDATEAEHEGHPGRMLAAELGLQVVGPEAMR